jgi:hypothetical protein
VNGTELLVTRHHLARLAIHLLEHREVADEIEQLPKYEILTEPRQKPFRCKEEIVVEKEFKNKVLVGEDIAEIEYRPVKCKKAYRVVIVRKNISVKEGERHLVDEIRYFFYITNRKDKAPKIVGLANGRCDQENVIEQLKNGVNAMRMPVNDLLSNWAYMVMTALAWNLKAWFGLLMPDRERGIELVKMEFRRFLHAMILARRVPEMRHNDARRAYK